MSDRGPTQNPIVTRTNDPSRKWAKAMNRHFTAKGIQMAND